MICLFRSCLLLLFMCNFNHLPNAEEFMGGTLESRSTDECGCGASIYGGSSCEELSRIIGGRNSRKNEMPWMALILIKTGDKHVALCGGALINPWFIVTAAHCVHQKQALSNVSNIFIALGAHNISQNPEENRQIFKVSRIILHPQFNPTLVDNDIALLKLQESAKYSKAISPICLPTHLQKEYVGRTVTLSGWGLRNVFDKSSISHVLSVTSLILLRNSHPFCKDGHSRPMPSSKLCAYSLDRDACLGDSGGPLILKENGRCTLIGIVSYGFGCGNKFVAGVYSRITSFMDWIATHAAEGGCMSPFSSQKCDLSCTKVGNVTSGLVKIKNTLCSCNGGICYSMNPKEDLCSKLGDPCRQGLSCTYSNQCRLTDVLYGAYQNPSYDKIYNTTLLGIHLECNTRTGTCCDIDKPNVNLCETLKKRLEFIKNN